MDTRLRTLLMALGFALGLLGVSCESGDGDSEAAAAGEQLAVPENITFSFLTDSPMTVAGTVTAGTQPATAEFLQFSGDQRNFIRGVFSRGTRTWNLDNGSRFPVIMTVGAGSGNQRTFNISVSVVSRIFIAGDLQPTAGTLEFRDDAGNVVDVVIHAPSVGITLTQNNGGAVSFTLDRFQSLPGSGAPDWQQEAALSFLALKFIMYPLAASREILDDILINRNGLEQRTRMQIPCDSLKNSNPLVQAPASLPDQGMETLALLDSNGNSLVDTGDGFTLTFTDCFDQDMEVIFINGFVKLLGFIEENDGSTITTIGFQPAEGAGIESSSGGITFSDTEIWISRETATGPAIDGTALITVNGGFLLVFSQ